MRESVADRDEELELLDSPAERLEEDARAAPLTEEQMRERSADYFAIVGAMGRAFAGGEELARMEEARRLSDEERDALGRFEQAVQGRTGGRTLLAEDRLAALGEALAVLQPALAVGLDPNIPHALDTFHALVDSVDALRDSLVSLEDAQEELFEQDKLVEEARPPADTDEGDQGEAKHDAEAPAASTLSGEPAAPDVAPRPSTLHGAPGEPAVETPVVPSTAYDGDER